MKIKNNRRNNKCPRCGQKRNTSIHKCNKHLDVYDLEVVGKVLDKKYIKQIH